jgi:hypothetical protein
MPDEMTARRFPPPWRVEETDACFIVRDDNGQALSYVYFEIDPGRQHADIRRSAANCGQHCEDTAVSTRRCIIVTRSRYLMAITAPR